MSREGPVLDNVGARGYCDGACLPHDVLALLKSSKGLEQLQAGIMPPLSHEVPQWSKATAQYSISHDFLMVQGV